MDLVHLGNGQIMYAPLDFRFVGIFVLVPHRSGRAGIARPAASYSCEDRLSWVFRIQFGKLRQNLLRTFVAQLRHNHLYSDDLVAGIPSWVADGTPFPRMRNFCPLWVPGGIFNWARPSIVGTSILAPEPLPARLPGPRSEYRLLPG